MEINASDVKKLRDMTGAGMMDCKKALGETGGDFEKAVDQLRKKGIASAEKRSGRDATEGIIQHYVHFDQKKGCLVELNCETDFVARTDDFQAFAKDVALHVVARRPSYLKPEDVPADVLEREKSIHRDQAAASGKPPQVIEKIIEGRLAKYYEEVCLLNQAFVKDDTKTVGEMAKELAGKLGENVQIRRFVVYEVGRADA
ncbi:MAG: translation elongation factor Ts [Deltaproteobacteria bacterium]|nr:translation elongation factor Ts [Deltaproteobacteria bacterium]